MSNVVTKNDFDKLDEKIEKRFDDLTDIMQTFMHQVDTRFNKVEEKIDSFDEKIDRLINTIDAFVKRLDEVEVEQTARDAQFDRLVEWAKKVSEKTGIPLKNL
jgi:septal ring factor EnvC (AmiA/AmiB activator)